jgi:urease accessory protein
MLRIGHVAKSGSWPATEARETFTLTYEERYRRRGVFRTKSGEDCLLDLPRAVLLEDGDGLALPGGGFILIRADLEPVIEVRATSPAMLCRLAWHLGNRHLPAEIKPGRILIRPDYVIQAMLEGLGARLKAVRVAFNPEGGAYAAPGGAHAPEPGHGHGHEQGHGHGHDQP